MSEGDIMVAIIVGIVVLVAAHAINKQLDIAEMR